MQENYEKLWGGCFTDNIDPKFHDLNASINIDKRMYAEDIEGSVAYAKAIRLANLLTDEELESILNGFKQMKAEWEEGRFIIHIKDEDIHAANERRLTELIGDVAKKLHIGRSRNDQTITDTKLWLRKAIDVLLKKLMKFIQVLVDRAENEIEIIMPGYTHMQRAQPIKWSQWLLSYAWYAKADIERLQEIRKRVNILPLGSGAIAGNPFQIDRRILANELDFSEITENSMYAIGDRDFVGSSLMPQKRNPDCMELIRGKAGTLLGKCMGFMTTLKGIPSTYNKDLQEDKEAIFSTFDILDSILVIATNAINTLEVKNKKCEKALTSTMLATDMVYYLVRKGISFREAHYLTGKAVALSESLEVSLCKLSLKKLHSISTKFQKDVKEIWNFSHSIEQYKVTGGTSTTALIEQINKLRTSLINNSI
ncbi:argininosuccinate lyase isoform X2 [Apis mellifera]|uniref:Argininosuccinate lyase isoform X2 n=1 Tax=Apis mellifera TaxID=7460 RepID=A0A7M7LSX6_APIME|nr:argininosuccinate lyase isoform X2 [Apis mellifera]|eukprot:XP_006569627.2 argininosuccinate lyase isoform X2 [Apis mellifera]